MLLNVTKNLSSIVQSLKNKHFHALSLTLTRLKNSISQAIDFYASIELKLNLQMSKH